MYKIIKTLKDFQECLEHVKSYEYISYDTETTGLNVRKASIVGISVSGKPGCGYYIPIKLWNKEREELEEYGFSKDHSLYITTKELVPTLLRLLQEKKLLMHNASFDIRITKNDLKCDLTNALYADSMLLKHTCDENQPFGMEDLVERNEQALLLPGEVSLCKDVTILKENIKANGGSTTKDNYEIWKADLEILGTYAAKDADLTLRLFNLYSKSLKQQGLEKFFYETEVMPLYKEVTIPMEENGIKLNMPLLEKTSIEISLDIKNLEEKIQEKIKLYSTNIEKDILDKSIKISNKGTFAQALLEKYNIKLPLTKAGKFSITKKNLSEYYNQELSAIQNQVMEFLLGEEPGFSLLAEFEELQRQLYLKSKNEKYVLNINSKDQLGKIFFEEMGETPLSETPGGKPQVNDTFLESISDTNIVAKLLLEYNKLVKIKSSYIDRFLRENEEGLFYPEFKQHGTKSGRYGSDFQQLNRKEDPKDSKLSSLVLKYNNIIRDFFISKKGCSFIDADQSQLEVRVFASDAGDKSLLEVFEKDLDIYSQVAIEAYDLHNKYSASKKDSNFLKKEQPEIRQIAKAATLALRYGCMAFKLSKILNIELEEAELFHIKFFEKFPGVKIAMNKCLELLKRKGYVQSYYGRIRHMQEAKEIFDKYSEDILDYKKNGLICRRYGLSKEEISVIRKKLANYINSALNHPIQSAAASILNISAISINKEFKNKNIKAKIIAQIHDELLIECKDEQIEEAFKLIKDKMENSVKLKGVKLYTDPIICKNYGEAK
jgi:DNA polymerase I-like protein with 3'-5' exonuclease and polymerase domains